MVLHANALQAVHGKLKAASNEEHFTIEVKKVFGLYLPNHLSGVTE
jgi:hypothetical protein